MDDANGEPVKFTPLEFLLLFYLCEKELQAMPEATDVVALREKIKRLQLQQLPEDDQT